MQARFEWDVAKAQRNRNKHGVSFETAARVFADPFALAKPDRIEGGERRWQTLGMVEGRVVLLVAHTVRDGDDGNEIIRIISARRADPNERKHYEQNRQTLRD